MKLKDVLKGKLTEAELKHAPSAFDVIGDVAVIEIPEKLENRKREIAEAIVTVHRSIRTVCAKSGEREGDFRTRPLDVLIGKDTRTEHREHGCIFRLDIRDVYFSPREATERQHIAQKVKPGENVLVMFCGVGPSPIVIAKLQPKVGKVYGVDINPDAIEYASENVRINKLSHLVIPLVGDVRKVCPTLGLKFDRITMPLPKGAQDFLDVALACLKPGGTIHFYCCDREGRLFDDAVKIVKLECKKAGVRCRILDKRKVLPYGPRIWKLCIDFRAG